MNRTFQMMLRVHDELRSIYLGPADNYGRNSARGRALRERRNRLCRIHNYLFRRNGGFSKTPGGRIRRAA